MASVIDPSGTAFNNDVYVWTADQFSRLPTTEGATFSMTSTSDPQTLFIDARFTTPLIYTEQPTYSFVQNKVTVTEPYPQHTATGTITTESGQTLTFDNDDVTYSDIRYFERPDGNYSWLVKATDAGGDSFYISNYGFVNGETYTLGSPVNGFPAYSAVVDLNPGPGSNTDPNIRIDAAATPDSPLYFQNPTDLSNTGYLELLAYNNDDFDNISDGTPGLGDSGVGKVFQLKPDIAPGSFRTYDNDNYIQDGGTNFESPTNDYDQYGEYLDADGNVIFGGIYQAEVGWLVENETGKLYKLVKIAFDQTYFGNSITFTSEPLDPDQTYQVINKDGTPGAANSDTDQAELAFQYVQFNPPIDPTCFASGALIKTESGLTVVEDLAVGDMVWTKDNGYQPIRWIGRREVSAEEIVFNERLRPIRIKAGALGDQRPFADLAVSRHHRMAIQSRIAMRVEGVDTVLVEAKDLLGMDGIDVVNNFKPVVYHHILFDQHQIVEANGCATESLFTGPDALRAVSKECREELLTLFPELEHTDELLCVPAASILTGPGARELIGRHIKNGVALQ